MKIHMTKNDQKRSYNRYSRVTFISDHSLEFLRMDSSMFYKKLMELSYDVESNKIWITESFDHHVGFLMNLNFPSFWVNLLKKIQKVTFILDWYFTIQSKLQLNIQSWQNWALIISFNISNIFHSIKHILAQISIILW